MPKKLYIDSVIGHLSELLKKYSGDTNSFHVFKNVRTITVAKAGFNNGKIIDIKSRVDPQPSMTAASSSSLGILATNPCIRKTENGSCIAAYNRITLILYC